MSETTRDGHAVVIGASVAGLLAARVLSDAYARVTVLERDGLPALGEQRRAVPQGYHLHALLASGHRALEKLLPGISDELVDAGALICRSMSEIHLEVAGHQVTRDAVGADVLLASRPLIEGVVRQRVRALANVMLRERCVATGLDADRTRVTGVRLNRGETVGADLVVAASGRAATLPGWLEELGYPRPEEERLRVDLTYVSRPVRLRPGALNGKLVLIGARPGLPRGMGLIAQEDGRWMLTASGYGAPHRPPTDEARFMEFIASVAPPQVVAAIRESEPLGDLVTHGFPANQRRRYEHLERFPDGLLAIGDAITSFNPLYGQGMSVAALEAIELGRCVRDGADGVATRFFKAAAKVVDPAWELAVGGDLALPEVAGPRPLSVRISNAYVERLLRVAEHDPVVASAFSDVCDLLAPPQSVMAPSVLWRVLRNRRPRSAPAPAAAPVEAAAS